MKKPGKPTKKMRVEVELELILDQEHEQGSMLLGQHVATVSEDGKDIGSISSGSSVGLNDERSGETWCMRFQDLWKAYDRAKKAEQEAQENDECVVCGEDIGSEGFEGDHPTCPFSHHPATVIYLGDNIAAKCKNGNKWLLLDKEGHTIRAEGSGLDRGAFVRFRLYPDDMESQHAVLLDGFDFRRER